MRVYALTALWAVAICAGLATAQQATQEEPNRQGQPAAAERGQAATQGEAAGRNRAGARAGENSAQDRTFARMLAIDNALEVQFSEIAEPRLQDEQVKQFAKQMVEAHRKQIEELRNFGAEEVMFRGAARTERNSAGRDNAATAAGNSQTRPREEAAATRGEAADGHMGGDFVEIKREIAEQCLQSAQEELASKSGREADKCFMAAQVFGHQKMLDTLTVLERHASPEFAQALAKATQTTRQHLDHARQMLETMETPNSQPGERGSQTPSSSTPPRTNP